MSTYKRTDLGDFNSIVCFKAVITGMEDMLGAKATAISLKGAGRRRGAQLAESLGFTRGQADLGDLTTVAELLNTALGVNGTRLCAVDDIKTDGDDLLVLTRETVCSANEPLGSPRECTFTLGAVHGALEFLLDAKYTPRHVESVLRGAEHDVFRLTPR